MITSTVVSFALATGLTVNAQEQAAAPAFEPIQVAQLAYVGSEFQGQCGSGAAIMIDPINPLIKCQPSHSLREGYNDQAQGQIYQAPPTVVVPQGRANSIDSNGNGSYRDQNGSYYGRGNTIITTPGASINIGGVKPR